MWELQTHLSNVDLKLFSKIVINHINPFLPAFIHRDQIGFVPGSRSEGQYYQNPPFHLLCPSAFHFILLFDLRCQKGIWIGLNGHFSTSLYNRYDFGEKSRAQIHHFIPLPQQWLSPKEWSPTLSIANGIRQGSPLSLFVIVNEYLAQAIWQPLHRWNPNNFQPLKIIPMCRWLTLRHLTTH